MSAYENCVRVPTFEYDGGQRACSVERAAMRPDEMLGSAVAYPIRLGHVFVDDHESRDCPAGIVVAESKQSTTRLLTLDDIRDLYSDADYYVDCMHGANVDFDQTFAPVVAAAKRVMATIERQLPELYDQYKVGYWKD
jgi:hypothetical protein